MVDAVDPLLGFEDDLCGVKDGVVSWILSFLVGGGVVCLGMRGKKEWSELGC